MYIKNLNDYLKRESKNPVVNRKYMLYNHFLLKLVGLAKSVINWLELPLCIPEIITEEQLLFHGVSVFFIDDVTGIPSILPCVVDSTLDRYGLPKGCMAYGLNGYTYHVDLEAGKGVLIWDNYNRVPIMADLAQYAQRMTDTLLTVDVNLRQQRIPIVFKTTQQGKRNVEAAMQAQDAGAFACIVDKTQTEEVAEPMYQAVPYIADKLQIELEKIWAEALTFIGIANVDEKAERLNSFEVGSQIEETVSMLNMRLKPRREACQKINKLFGPYLLEKGYIADEMDVIPASWILTRDRSETIQVEQGQPEEVFENETD